MSFEPSDWHREASGLEGSFEPILGFLTVGRFSVMVGGVLHTAGLVRLLLCSPPPSEQDLSGNDGWMFLTLAATTAGLATKP